MKNVTKRDGKKQGGLEVINTGTDEDITYRFPYSRAIIEPVPDFAGAATKTFAVRLAWQRGKAAVPLFESTALRPIAQVTLRGQKFPVFLSQHGRKRRELVLLTGRRRTSKSPRCALRFLVYVEGREDRLTWRWRVGATAAALATMPLPGRETEPDALTLFLPFPPGKAKVLTLPGIPHIAAIWLNDLVMSVRVVPPAPEEAALSSACPPTLSLMPDARGLQLTLLHAPLGGSGVSLAWETWAQPARTEGEARAALLKHAAETSDREQIAEPQVPGTILEIGDRAEAALIDEKRIVKRGADRQIYQMPLADGSMAWAAGEGAETARAAAALLLRHYHSGDDALRRRARLLSHGACDFQVQTEDSPHWGAVWDAQQKAGKLADYLDRFGGKTLSVAATARTAQGLFVTHAHFETELLQRTALAAAQWLLLKLDRDGRIDAERFTEDGPPAPSDTPPSPWVCAEALVPFLTTFHATRNETFLKAAQRTVNGFQESLALGTLLPESAPTEHLAAAIEGILLLSQEYENPDLITLAKQLAVSLRARREQNGFLRTLPGEIPVSPLAPTLAASRAALALCRVDDDPLWLLMALRGLRAAGARADEATIADHAALCSLSNSVLLGVAGRAKSCVPNRDTGAVTRTWQTFVPDPATREFVRVTAPDGTALDHRALVCQVSLQVLIAVIAPPDVREVIITKNNKTPFVKNLLNGDFDQKAVLLPLGDGKEFNIGVFQADT